MASEMDTVEMDGGMNHDGKAKEEAVVYDNALREDIGRKGKNAYYYAFSRVADGPKWDGKEEPRLLHKGTSALVSGPPKVKTLDIPEYSWVDGKKNVKVYIDTEFLELEIEENHVELTHTENSFCVTISLPNKKYKLSVSALHKPISSSAFVLKNRRITVSLQKSDEDSSWYKLHDS